MNTLSTYILEYLKEHNKAEILAFGTFFMKKSSAKVISEENNILPPAKEIFLSLDENVYSSDFVQFIAKKENYSIETAEKFINNDVSQWKKNIEEGRTFEIPHLGKWILLGEKYTFVGERVSDFAPDYFGLEEINLTELQTKTPYQEEFPRQDDKFNNAILWTFLFLLPILGILVAGILYSNVIFGKKSFEEISIKRGTNRIEKTILPPKKDTLSTTNIDSLSTKK